MNIQAEFISIAVEERVPVEFAIDIFNALSDKFLEHFRDDSKGTRQTIRRLMKKHRLAAVMVFIYHNPDELV